LSKLNLSVSSLSDMDKLSLPVFDINIKEYDGKTVIFDIIRKKYLVLTPEEWVRQHFVHFLINHLGYTKALIGVEQGLKYNTLQKRTDIIVYDRLGKPLVLVECKEPSHRLNQKVMEQAMMYNKTLAAPYIIVSNGIDHSCMHVHPEKKKVEFLKEIPRFEEIA
jgi:Type I restriction enzyme R protein N terminus (HSDR_N)